MARLDNGILHWDLDNGELQVSLHPGTGLHQEEVVL